MVKRELKIEGKNITLVGVSHYLRCDSGLETLIKDSNIIALEGHPQNSRLKGLRYAYYLLGISGVREAYRHKKPITYIDILAKKEEAVEETFAQITKYDLIFYFLPALVLSWSVNSIVPLALLITYDYFLFDFVYNILHKVDEQVINSNKECSRSIKFFHKVFDWIFVKYPYIASYLESRLRQNPTKREIGMAYSILKISQDNRYDNILVVTGSSHTIPIKRLLENPRKLEERIKEYKSYIRQEVPYLPVYLLQNLSPLDNLSSLKTINKIPLV